VKIHSPRQPPATTFASEFMQAFNEGPRIYLAPLVGAFRAIRDEMSRVAASRGQPASTLGRSGPDSL
jgi:hypothetical protein